jgi:hypothetical protein
VAVPGKSHLAVTYAGDRIQDGAGAQLQRVYGVYALSRALGVPYVHTPIEHIGYHGLTALENDAPTAELLSDVNRVFAIPSDLEVPRAPVVHDQPDADAEAIAAIRDAPPAGGAFHLIRICLPYPVTDRDPETYRCVQAISPFPHYRSDVFRVAIHVRRGDLHAVDSDRMLPNSYYLSCARQLVKLLRRLGIPFVCELYTEAVTRTFEVTPQHHGISGRTAENVTFHPGMDSLEDFDAVPNLERHVNLDPIESLRRMATADALIMSRSSFSYVAAILSRNSTVICHPFWHGAMQDWLLSESDGSLPERELADRLGSWQPAALR